VSLKIWVPFEDGVRRPRLAACRGKVRVTADRRNVQEMSFGWSLQVNG
jgi:hypothetical protein